MEKLINKPPSHHGRKRQKSGCQVLEIRYIGQQRLDK